MRTLRSRAVCLLLQPPRALEPSAKTAIRGGCVRAPIYTFLLESAPIGTARALSYCIRRKLLPEDVRLLFGGFSPSVGHGNRICKILKSEWSRQARLYRIHLEAQLHNLLGEDRAKRAFRDFNRLANQTTEFLWQSTLSHLRSYPRPKKKKQDPGSTVFTEGNVMLPEDVKNCLAQGPKFAVKPPTTAPEKLSLVRKVSSLAPVSEMDRCVSSGVDVLMRDQCDPGRPAINRDSGYPLDPWLLTPVPGHPPMQTAERKYNTAHATLRSVVERCIGLLMSRFRWRQRYRTLLYERERAANMCCVAHTIFGCPRATKTMIKEMTTAAPAVVASSITTTTPYHTVCPETGGVD
ncbi:hypothetical protein HPB49_009098 [Dermacentor silvarum]|uniref:Uncharacterized protein n=1 Tax=Dermacentor silvarum TaxID=543639 RepID=A0ACB8C2T5_DERSI|nr:hypothetical protein HPB49_009098 [Dermacentor silvarum]